MISIRKERSMKRISVLHLLIAVSVALASPLFGQDKPFSEETAIPEGKALVYFYMPKGLAGSASAAWVLTEHGPVAVLSNGFYKPYLADPGALTLWPLFNIPQAIPAKFLLPVTIDLVAGNTYYIKVSQPSASPGKGCFQKIPTEKAKTSSEILPCSKLE